MRYLRLHCTLVLLHCLFFSATAFSQLQKIYLQPKAAGNGKQTDFVDSVRFIPLESKGDLRLGYFNLYITPNLFLINNYTDKSILLYSKSGSFVKKINYKKLGNVFPSYNQKTNQLVFFGTNKNYALLPKDEIQIKLDWNNPHNKKYFKKHVVDLSDPSFALKKATPDQNDILNAYALDDDYYIQQRIATSPLYKDSLDYEIKLYKDNQLVKSLFPYNRVSEPRFLYTQETVSFNRTDVPQTYFITRPYSDTIYKMKKDSLFPAYHLVTPLENSLPSSFFTKPFKNKTERENFNRNNGWMLHQVYNFYETQNFIYLVVAYLSNYESYIYQKKTGATYKARNIKADASHYNMQLFSDFNVTPNEGWFYISRKANELIAFFEKNKNIPVPTELEAFLKSNPSANSPIIVAFKFKN